MNNGSWTLLGGDVVVLLIKLVESFIKMADLVTYIQLVVFT